MIKRIRLHNFRSFLNAEFQFAQRHLLIGRNNSGKSNLMFALKFVASTAAKRLGECAGMLPGGVWEFCNFSVYPKNRIALMEIECEPIGMDGHVTFTYRLRLEVSPAPSVPAGPPVLVLREESLVMRDPEKGELVLIESDGRKARLHHVDSTFKSLTTSDEIDAPHDETTLSRLHESPQYGAAGLFRRFLLGIGYFSLAANEVRSGWVQNSSVQGLFVHGGNLAPMLYQLKTQDDSRYRRVLDRIRKIEPSIKALNFLVGPELRVVPQVELDDREHATWVGLSDGTLRALALSYVIELAGIHSRLLDPFSVCMLIEEPENCLYVGELHSLLYDLDNVAGMAQFMFTSHSPYFIDQFDNDLSAVTLMKREGAYTTGTTLQSREAEIHKALEEMPLGEQFFRELLR